MEVRRRIEIRGVGMKTPSAPWKARARAAASVISASAREHPRATQGSALAGSRATARTSLPAVKRNSATEPPTCPVIPVMAYVASLRSSGRSESGPVPPMGSTWFFPGSGSKATVECRQSPASYRREAEGRMMDPARFEPDHHGHLTSDASPLPNDQSSTVTGTRLITTSSRRTSRLSCSLSVTCR